MEGCSAEQWFLVTDKGFGDIRVYPPGSAGVLILRPDEDGIRPMVELFSRHWAVTRWPSWLALLQPVTAWCPSKTAIIRKVIGTEQRYCDDSSISPHHTRAADGESLWRGCFDVFNHQHVADETRL
jgi:hypothetical protein